MGLHSLRQHISVIPQTPFFIRGTVRQNVDPFERVSEQEMWHVLKVVHLADTVRSVKYS
jgi:ATP-binding cassette, subfamily C (CFTR/MRP), member 4